MVRARAALVQDRRLLRDPHPRLLRRQRRRLRRLPRPDREARLPAVARRRLHLAAAVLRARRCATAATTSPTSSRSTPTTARSTTSATFIDAAHARRIRVIADLVMNHTSSDHQWFQEARTAPDNPNRDYYVWSDTDDRYSDARIIFTDTETSNWTWDPVAGAVLLAPLLLAPAGPQLRQPEGPGGDARDAALLARPRLDGFRLDAVPYLFERDGTNGENLPETHDYLKRVRTEVDEKYPDRVLLAEANQWPADVVEYFGDGDECQMAFHFPVMPRMFMAVRREEADADLRDPRADAGDPRQLPVGPVPAQPRRADARDGHRRGARLHVRGVRQGPAHEDQRRASAAGSRRCSTTAATRSS